MSGDPTNSNDDELLSQIDELKARMDRLMSGGTSTSNSALLTDEAKPGQKPGEPKLVDRPADPAPNRTRVRDLIGPDDDVELVESYPGSKAGVPFPDGPRDDSTPPVVDPEPKPVAEAKPNRSAPIGGSVINLEREAQDPRPQAATFDDIGSAIQEELAKDTSVPSPDVKKGPDLASRFGPAEKAAIDSDPPHEAVTADVPDEVEETFVEETDDLEAEEVFEPARRGSLGRVAAIWAVAAVASGAVATLHFAGII